MYSANNPLNLIDVNGKLPGDAFSSADQAAHDFGKNYGIISIKLNLEVSASIYKYNDENGNEKFTYNTPNAFGKISGNTQKFPIEKAGYERVAGIHAHGAVSGYKISEEEFSRGDRQTVKDQNVPHYLVTPSGYLKKLNPDENRAKTIGKVFESSSLDKFNVINSINEGRPIPLWINPQGTFYLENDFIKSNYKYNQAK